MIAPPLFSAANDMKASLHNRVFKIAKSQWWKMAVGVALAAIIGTGYVYRSPMMEATQEFIARMTGAEVARVEVVGVTYTSKETLMAALNIRKGEPLVGFNTLEARAKLEKLPWVRLASVEKKLPNGLYVAVYEHTPIARVADDEGAVWVVNKDGAPIIADANNQFGRLPLLEGAGSVDAAAKLFGVMATWPNLVPQLSKATYVGQRRWDLHFASGVVVMLPEHNPTQALAVLAQLEEHRHVLTLNAGTVDLRLPDRVTLNIPAAVGATPVTNQPAKQG